MTLVNKIDSNVTGLAYQEETSLGVANTGNPWKELAPNSYSDFGPSVTNVARAPIVNDRQRKKGVLTDLDASGGFSGDLTQEVLPDIGQGVFYADLEGNGDTACSQATLTGSILTHTALTGGDAFQIGDLIFVTGFATAANNGLKEIATVTDTTNITTVEALVDETTTAHIRRVGHEWAAGDLDVLASGSAYPTLTSGYDATLLRLIPGEWIFVGGDLAADSFPANAANNGWKRVRSITAGVITLDRSDATMVTEALTTETIRVFFGSRRLRNRGVAADIVRRSYQIERQLGYSDTDHDVTGGYQQAEYMEGAVASTLQVNIATADKMTFDIGFMGTTFSQVPSHATIDQRKVGSSRDAVVESEAYNSSSDVSRINMQEHSLTDEAPTQMFAYIQDLNFTIDNTLTANKAVGVLGAFDITAGIFAVSGSLNAFYADTATTTLIQTNADVSIDFHLSKANQGMSIDIPLVTLGDGRPNVEADAAIMVPLTFEAASGAKIDSAMDHTVMIMFYDYLPDAAAV